MIKIITPEQFRTTVWKNGKGKTLQLAISPGGSIELFDWRLSIASVIEDGVFSDFSGYQRSLILLEGDGIKLTHNDTRVDILKKPLSFSCFSGQQRTVGHLLGGTIKDFNVMAKSGKYKACVKTYVEKQSIDLSPSTLCFIFSKSHKTIIQTSTNEVLLPANHLMQLTEHKDRVSVKGRQYIIVYLKKL